MAKKTKKKTRCSAASADKKPVKKSSAKKPKKVVKGKVVSASLKGKRKHELKSTGEVVRFDKKKHPEKPDAHHVHVHGKEVDEGVQLVTPKGQTSVMASMRARSDIAPGSQFTFAAPADFRV
jgi:hypothetical protein